VALIVDTGVMYAALDRRDADHLPCRRLLDETDEAIVVPAPIIPEVDYLVRQRGGVGPFLGFLGDVVNGSIRVVDPLPDDYARAAEVMNRYADLNVGFVDAAVLAIVERLNEPKLATLDRRHFSVLRPRHVDALELVPA
jgi:predicted nucleic acid-binding protein